MSNTNNVNTINYEDYFELSNGTAQLKKDYKGSENSWKLPEVMVIPDTIGDTKVKFLADSMFKNNTYVKEITLPTTVTAIPLHFCLGATNLRAIHNTEQIKYIGAMAFMSTRIKEALFPNLETLDVTEMLNNYTGKMEIVSGAFANCAYLATVNIGKVSTIPMRAFYKCAHLREVTGGENVSRIEAEAFFHTRSLRDLPLLNHIPTVEDYAFYYSRIVPSLPIEYWDNENAFPVGDNKTDFWTGVDFTPCCNRIRTKLSQVNPAWKDTPFPVDSPKQTYESHGCPLFSVMHIHSAITGKYYSTPAEFVTELVYKGQSKYLKISDWPGDFENVVPMFKALGYHAEVHGTGTKLSKDDYQTLVDALADGAYIYAQVGRHGYSVAGYSDGGHAVVIYGINELGEVCVLGSDVLHEPFRAGGFEPGIDVYTYTMPYQNIVGPGSDFVIVYPPEKKPVVQWTGYAAPIVYTSASLPSEYPENQVTICRVTNDNKMPGSKNGILTAYRVGDIAYRAYMPDTEAALHLQVQSEAEDAWSDWVDCNQKDFTRVPDNQVLENTPPSDIPDGVSVCAVSRTDSGLPDGGIGYMTTYRLQSPATESTDNVDIIREEWHPMMNHRKYVRYATILENSWGPWHVFTPKGYTPPAEGASGEGQ